MRRLLIFSLAIVVIVITNIYFLLGLYNKENIAKETVTIVNDKISYIDKFINKYTIGKTGLLEVTANYKGAHGENYPSDYVFNYELADKLYFENNEYASIDYPKEVISLITTLKNLKNIDLTNLKVTRLGGKYEVSLDTNDINKKLNTNFKDISFNIYTKGLIHKVDYLEFKLDDLYMTLTKDSFNIKFQNNNIRIDLNADNVYLNVNDILKVNVLIKDLYSCSIVLGDKVYYLEIKDDGFYLKFNSPSAIYNSITINGHYSYMILNKEKEIEKLTDNPIVNYISNTEFNFWR